MRNRKPVTKNPFQYGVVVTGSAFADRQAEMRQLAAALMSSERVFLISPRRYGKTSLLVNLGERLKARGLLVAHLDLFRATSLKEFLEQYAAAVARAAESKIERAVRMLSERIPRLHPKVEIDPSGSASVTVELAASGREMTRAAVEVLNLPEQLAEQKGKSFAVLFDEFQEVEKLDGADVEKLLRSVVQHHQRVGYVFAGSKRHTLYDMVTNRGRAFYNMGKILTLETMPRDEFRDHLVHLFHSTGVTAASSLIDAILDRVEDRPYDAQFVCHEAWEVGRETGGVTDADVEAAIDRIIQSRQPVYEQLWQGLTPRQRAILKALTEEREAPLYSQRFRAQFGLGSPSSVQRSVELLMAKEILDKMTGRLVFSDVFFREWIYDRAL
jgi:hypothetical protein